MPIEVEIPGKGIAEFPDGTDQLSIVQAIARSFPDVEVKLPRGESAAVPEPGSGLGGLARNQLPDMPDQLPTMAERVAVEAERPEEVALQRKLETPLINLPVESYAAPLTTIVSPDIARGFATKAKALIEGQTSPAGLSALPYMAVAGAEGAALGGIGMAGKAIAATFSAQALESLPEDIRNYVSAVQDGDREKASEAWLGMAADSLFAVGGVGALGSKGKAFEPPKIDPLTPHENVLPAATETFRRIAEPAEEGAAIREEPIPQRDAEALPPEEPPGTRPQVGEEIRVQDQAPKEEITSIAPTPESEVKTSGGTGGVPEEIASVGDAPTVQNTGVPEDAIKSSPVVTPSAPTERPLGIVASSTAGWLANKMEPTMALLGRAKQEASWKTFAQETLPNWTESNREVGESGARYAAAPMVGRELGLRFAREVLGEHQNDPVFDRNLGTAIKEDNLRDIRMQYQKKAEEARNLANTNPNASEAYLKDAELYENAAKAVVTLVGAKNSPFRTEAAYRAFLDSAEAQAAIERYKQLWAEQKEPMFREAAGIDPETELPSRGLETGARINLTFVKEGQVGIKPVSGSGGTKLKQLGTLLRRDPFLRQATGTGTSYHPELTETMAHAFEREYPIAAQHEFIRKAIESGVAEVGDGAKPPDGFNSYILKINPWKNQHIYIPKKLAGEYEALVGLKPGVEFGVVTPLAKILTTQSIYGLGEGTAHSANILLKVFTGLQSSHPLIEALASSLGRADLLYALPRIILRALKPDGDGLLELAKINAAKRPYEGIISSKFLNPLDVSVRLVSRDVYKGLAEKGIVPDTETGLREFVNEIGNYTQSVQSPLVRNLRSSGFQPFATGFRTAKVQAIKRLALSPGAKALDSANAAYLRLAIASKFVGTAVLVGTLNYLLNKDSDRKWWQRARGPVGSRLGSVSWKDKDGKLKTFDLGGLFGATSGARAIGLMGIVEAKERNLDTSTALKQGGRSLTSTVKSQFAGPLVRFGSIALTGKDPYGNQIADVAPPNQDLLRSQQAQNIIAALEEANPLVSFAVGIHQGKTWEEISQRQLTRYATYSPSSLATSDRFTEVVTKKNLMEYADWLANRSRKLPLNDRSGFVQKRLDEDKVTGPSRKEVLTELKRKGVYKYR